MEYIIIHVGKCSGTILQRNLKYHKISFKCIHHANKRNPAAIIPNQLTNGKGNYQFIFCIRHPIDRLISAFNYKYTRSIIQKLGRQFKPEIEGFKYFETIQKLAENLYNKDGSENLKAINFCSNCDHINYGLHHYLNNFNETYNIRVIRHEYLKEDYNNIFNKDIHLPENSVRPNFISNINSPLQKYTKIEITKKMYNNLKRFLKKDMDIIERLEKYNLITKEYKEFCLNKLPNNIIITD